MDTIEKIKVDALQLVLDMADGDEERSTQARDKAKTIQRRYSELKARYKYGDKVWYLEGLCICECVIVGIYVNAAGCDFYRIGEVGGRTMMGNAFLPGNTIFPTRKALIEAVMRTLIQGTCSPSERSYDDGKVAGV